MGTLLFSKTFVDVVFLSESNLTTTFLSMVTILLRSLLERDFSLRLLTITLSDLLPHLLLTKLRSDRLLKSLLVLLISWRNLTKKWETSELISTILDITIVFLFNTSFLIH